MFVDESEIKRIFSKIDQDELVQLAMTLANISSPTGSEAEIANYILNWFDEMGFHSIKQEVEEARFNAIGVLHGTGDGPSLMFNGHLDTLVPNKPVERAYVSNGRIYGNEIANMKGAIAALMIAAKAIKDVNIELSGDLIISTVVGEISTGAIEWLQGPQDRGEGVGTRHLLTNGVQSDYAVVADGSEFAIVRAQAGVAYFRISVKGTALYTPFTRRPEDANESENAIIKTTKIIAAIESWAREYERKNIYSFPGGRVEPKVSITAIYGGMPSMVPGEGRTPFNPSQTPHSCDIYVDVRLAPDIRPLRIKQEIEGLLSGLPFEWEIQMFRSQRGYEGKGPEVDYLSNIVEKAYEDVFQSKPPLAPPHTCSMWTDTNIYWELGIPAVKWGPSDGHKYGTGSHAIEDLVQSAKVYSLITLGINLSS